MGEQQIDYVAVAKSLYPDFANESAYDYEPIIKYFGPVAVINTDKAYSGDTRVLYNHPEKGFGCLTFGWGSCSGCDALQACNSYEDVASLIHDIENRIRWGSRADTLEFLRTHDWGGDYSWSPEFVEKSIEYMEAML